MKEGTGTGIYGQSVGRRFSISLRRYATVFQAEVYAISACVHEIQLHGRPEKHESICCDSQAALNALQAARTTSPSVQQCQKALNDISTGMLWGCIGSLDLLVYEEIKWSTSLQETVLFKFLLDLIRLWESLGRIKEGRLVAGWLTSNGQGGEVWVIHRDRLENSFRDPVRVPGIGFCHLKDTSQGRYWPSY